MGNDQRDFQFLTCKEGTCAILFGMMVLVVFEAIPAKVQAFRERVGASESLEGVTLLPAADVLLLTRPVRNRKGKILPLGFR